MHREYYQHYAFTVKCDVIADRIKKDKPYKYAGYVLKQTVAAYEIDDCDGIYDWLTSDEYKALSSERQREYQYYEWNDWGGWYGVFNTLYQRITALLDWFQEGGIPFSYDCPPDEKYPTLGDVRLIVISE